MNRTVSNTSIRFHYASYSEITASYTYKFSNFYLIINREKMKKVIFTEKAPAAIGPYSQAVEVNGMVFLSGQIPVDPATGEFVPGGVAEQTAQAFENIKHVLAAAGLTTANIVKTTVFLADMSLFAEMNAVYAKYFEGDFPARSAIAVKALPKGALVEIESIAAK